MSNIAKNKEERNDTSAQFISFKSGLIGFEECSLFQLDNLGSELNIFGLVDMTYGYRFILKEVNVKNYDGCKIDMDIKKNTIKIFCITSLKKDNAGNLKGYMNMKAPLIIDYSDFSGVQIVINNKNLSLSEPVLVYSKTTTADI